MRHPLAAHILRRLCGARVAPDSDRGKRPDRADGLPGRTRYDAEWPDVLAAEVGGWAARDAAAAMQEKVNETWAHRAAAAASIGGDLAAMAAPLGMDWGVDWRYVDAPADLPAGMARDDLGTYAEPAEPRGRHRQTDPLDLILSDLRDIEDRLS